MVEPLIPILPAIKATRIRREKDFAVARDWPKSSYNKTGAENNTRRLHIWIWKYTEGAFFLTSNVVAFQDEKEFLLFKLTWKDDN